MIELLIVIGVLGILAVGVLAAVDPFEQLKKARDTNTRSSALALQTAFVRYYATHGQLPWDMGDNNLAPCNLAFGAIDRTESTAELPVGASAAGPLDTADTGCVALLEADGELKPGFVAALGAAANTMFVNSNAVASVSVCFAPQSRSIFAEENTKWDEAGDDQTDNATPACTAGLKATGAAGSEINDCYYCAM